jgi:death-on-curing protein
VAHPLPAIVVEEAEVLHELVMGLYPGEPRGIRDRGLLESALLRPVHAALYQNADIPTQAATLLFGLIRNHPFVQGNKRTATVVTFFFLERAGYRMEAALQEVLDIVYAIDRGEVSVQEVAEWFRKCLRTAL